MDKETLMTIIDDLAEKFGLDRQVIVHMIETGKMEELLALKDKDKEEQYGVCGDSINKKESGITM